MARCLQEQVRCRWSGEESLCRLWRQASTLSRLCVVFSTSAVKPAILIGGDISKPGWPVCDHARGRRIGTVAAARHTGVTAWRVASPAFQLGTQKAASALAAARTAIGGHFGALAAPTGIDGASTCASPARTATAAAIADGAACVQSRMDCGLQGKFPHRRWRAAASLDGARFVLALCAVCAGLAASTDRAGPPCVYGVVSTFRSAASDSMRSRRALGFHRAPGLVGIVGVVVADGHPRGVYGQRTSRTECRA